VTNWHLRAGSASSGSPCDLLRQVRGQDKTPGEFRRSQNWINSPDNRPSTATFVPPPVEEMWQGLEDWEKYLHDENPRLPLLIRCALLYYQFETIHPFLDGNGRLGRLFIVVYRMDLGRLPARCCTCLPTSISARATTKTAFSSSASGARSPSGSSSSWTASLSRPRMPSTGLSSYLIFARSTGRGFAAAAGQNEVVDLLFASPILTVRYVQERLGLSQPGATNLLRRLAELFGAKE
jgi:hypothetical protein